MNKLRKNAFKTLLLVFVCSFDFLFSFNSFNEKKLSQYFSKSDSLSLKTAEEMGGGIYNRDVDAIIPFFPLLVRSQWLNYKKSISERIGPILPGPTEASLLWKNSANTIDQLLLDAQIASPYFLEMCLDVSRRTSFKANFGIDNQHMIKSLGSIKRKIEESTKNGVSEVESVNQIRDCLRGTIIVDAPEQISLVVQILKEIAHKIGREFIFINLWNDERPSGYVGIHAKMLFPIYDEKGSYTQRNIIVEIQIHLKSIMDGTRECIKEQSHLIYNQARKRKIDQKIQTAASTLLYLTALKECPNIPLYQLRTDLHYHFFIQSLVDIKIHHQHQKERFSLFNI